MTYRTVVPTGAWELGPRRQIILATVPPVAPGETVKVVWGDSAFLVRVMGRLGSRVMGEWLQQKVRLAAPPPKPTEARLTLPRAGGNGRGKWIRERLYHQYVVRLHSLSEIAKTYRAGETTIRKVMRKFGIPMRPTGTTAWLRVKEARREQTATD